MKQFSVLLTFDYELPLGSCKDYSRGLFEPADKLLKLAGELKVPVNLFVDICSLQMFKDWDYDKYFVPFKKQLQSALAEGHDIQLHLHPHWLTSKYRNGTYFPSNNFTLSHYRNNIYPNNISGIIENAVALLNEIGREVNPDFHCLAYRGGGFNLAPDTDLIINALYQYGIRIDSSIARGYYFRSNIQTSDYRKTPDKANWFISLNGELNSEANNGILEIPIASMPPYFIHRMKRYYKKIRNKKRYKSIHYDHTGTGYIGKIPDFRSKILNVIYSPFFFSFDYLTYDISLIDEIIRYNMRKYHKEDQIMLCAVSHPKFFGEYQLSLFHDAVSFIKSKYSGLLNFTTFRDIACILRLQ